MAYLMVFIGGGLGSLCRYGFAQWLGQYKEFPLGTFAANGVSCIILGALVALASRQILPLEYRLLLITGFCGGFSTFSTFSNELVQLFKQGEWGVGFAYLLGSLLIGIAGILVGMRLAE